MTVEIEEQNSVQTKYYDQDQVDKEPTCIHLHIHSEWM